MDFSQSDSYQTIGSAILLVRQSPIAMLVRYADNFFLLFQNIGILSEVPTSDV